MGEIGPELGNHWVRQDAQQLAVGRPSAMDMIASVAQLKSNLTEKGATRPTAMMRKKMPSGSSDLQEMPRRREYAER